MDLAELQNSADVPVSVDETRGAIGAGERLRLAALRETGLLDTPAEEIFDRYVRIASAITGAPTALISLVDSDRQWFKAKVGLGDVCETPRGVAFCAHAIQQSDLYVVENATADVRFADNPLVTGEPHIRFYAGVPLELTTGERLGTLCVIDYAPRTLNDGQADALCDLGHILVREIETRLVAERSVSLAEQYHAEKEHAEQLASDIRLVNRELNHRMGNLFAQVSGLVSMAARETDDRRSMVTAVRERVMALKSVSDLLMREEWQAVPIREIVETVLSPMRPQGIDASRIVIVGPQVKLSDRGALNMALILGELGANALRHGALSQPSGTVHLSWQRSGETFELLWCEKCDVAAQPKSSSGQGFGSVLLSRIAPAGLKGEADVQFTDIGMEYRLTAKLDHVEEGDAVVAT